MVTIQLPNGNVKEYQSGITPFEIAEGISSSLVKDSVIAKIDGEICDINTPINKNATVEIITTKAIEALQTLRHDCEHLLAQAVKELFPETEVIFGTSGKSEKSSEEFFYDFRREKPFSKEDLPKIEKKMLELASKNLEITRKVKPKQEAIDYFNSINEPFKAQIINDIIPEGEDISLYTQGNFTDLCKGPHYINTKFLRHFKLLKVSGSYWRGDATTWEFGSPVKENEYCVPKQYYCWQKLAVNGNILEKSKDFLTLAECYNNAKENGYRGIFPILDKNGGYRFNPNLQRITGTAFFKKQELLDYLTMVAEAEKRDHRKIGKDLSLFHISEEAVGSIFWHKNGWFVYRTIQEYIRLKQEQYGYEEVRTPQLINRELWEKSGHWEKYQENMFICEDEKHTFAIKPMNCPAHIEIFNQGLKSYKDLPIRMAEFGSCHRNEPSGALHGIMRVRAFTQDDAHIFCTEEQIIDEVKNFCVFLHEVYYDFGFKSVEIKLSTRPEKRSGTDETWDKAERGLAEATKLAGYEFETLEGEGAFYGPKLEFQLTDAIGRKWQCGTIQLDFVLPERLNAQYVTQDGNKQYTVILHRAILGSFERFIGILIENFAGKLPLWIAPVHTVVCSISEKYNTHAKYVMELLRKAGIIAECDTTDDKISYKIRKHSNQKVPYIITIGQKEMDENLLSIRTLGSNANSQMSVEGFAQLVSNKILNKEIDY
ncbi:MAG: threonyl-tRNA synthetase [Candidatus Deianiraeaceae bacterium]|jgi:threonyl-tRNA synthetase